MIIIGHRGCAGEEPENTLRSFVRAIEEGSHMIELDARLTKDGRLAVIHDASLNRTTNGKGQVSEKTMEELKEFDAGKGEKIPSLEEAIEAIDERVPILIELKSVGSAKALKDIISFYVSEGWSSRDFMVCSFEHDELRLFSEICPEVKIGVLEVPLGSAEYAEELGAYSVNIDFEGATEEFIKDAHNRGINVFVWTINEPERIMELKNKGVDGIITDFPGIARKTLTGRGF